MALPFLCALKTADLVVVSSEDQLCEDFFFPQAYAVKPSSVETGWICQIEQYWAPEGI
jgi:hypothetical protein